MSPALVALLFGALSAHAVQDKVASEAPTPVGKVIKLLEDLITTTETEGTAEATNYDKFACFCKSNTNTKSTAIKNGHDTIQTDSSTVAAKTATKEEKEEELKGLVDDRDATTKERRAITLAHEKNTDEYNMKAQDLSKAISSLTNAIKSMEDSKPAASFLAVRDEVKKDLALASVMNLIAAPRRQAVAAFVQVDPSDPVFKYHSQGIIDELNGLLADFRKNKKDLDIEWGKTVATFTSTSDSLDSKIQQQTLEINMLEGTTIPTLSSEIASARSSLVSAEATLKDDQLYLKDLTVLCETRAQDWDQRSALRRDELSNLRQALQVLENEVKDRDATYNKRTLFLEHKASGGNLGVSARKVGIVSHSSGPSLLQESSTKNHQDRGANLEIKGEASSKASRVSAFLSSEGDRLQSKALSAVAVHIDADPFGKVKELVQKLIERLIKESTAEATKKGYCDEELGMAYKARDFRLEETQDLNQDIQQLELKRDELITEISMLTTALQKLRSNLQTARQDREKERNANHEAIREANEGFKGTTEAITILKVFYKQAAKATVFQQASPVDEDTSGAGFAGAYNGQQESSKAIIGLLEVIMSDFDRTSRVTESAEKKAQAEFVEFERASLADISGKEEKKTLDEEDLATTRDNLKQKTRELQTAQNLLDEELKKLEALKPTCIDTGMSYAARVAKRQEEIDALKKALCILDTDDVESGCTNGQPTR